jgi:hypothetical protein
MGHNGHAWAWSNRRACNTPKRGKSDTWWSPIRPQQRTLGVHLHGDYGNTQLVIRLVYHLRAGTVHERIPKQPMRNSPPSQPRRPSPNKSARYIDSSRRGWIETLRVLLCSVACVKDGMVCVGGRVLEAASHDKYL